MQWRKNHRERQSFSGSRPPPVSKEISYFVLVCSYGCVLIRNSKGWQSCGPLSTERQFPTSNTTSCEQVDGICALGLDPSLVPCCFPEGHSQDLVPVVIICICLALSCSLPLSHQLWGSWHPAQRHPVWDRLHVQQDRELSMQPRLPDGTPNITHHPLHQRWHVESEQARLQRCVPSFTWHCGFRSLCRAVLHPFCAQKAVPAARSPSNSSQPM